MLSFKYATANFYLSTVFTKLNDQWFSQFTANAMSDAVLTGSTGSTRANSSVVDEDDEKKPETVRMSTPDYERWASENCRSNHRICSLRNLLWLRHFSSTATASNLNILKPLNLVLLQREESQPRWEIPRRVHE